MWCKSEATVGVIIVDEYEPQDTHCVLVSIRPCQTGICAAHCRGIISRSDKLVELFLNSYHHPHFTHDPMHLWIVFPIKFKTAICWNKSKNIAVNILHT